MGSKMALLKINGVSLSRQMAAVLITKAPTTCSHLISDFSRLENSWLLGRQ